MTRLEALEKATEKRLDDARDIQSMIVMAVALGALTVFGAAIFSPFDRTAKCVRPRSIPTIPSAAFLEYTASSHSIETKYLPAASFVTVTVVTVAALGMLREKMIESGFVIFASFSDTPSHLKALVVYSADCLSCLDLKDGYFVRLAKKLQNADCKCRNACCTGTELTSFNHKNSGCFFSAVSAADVS